MLSVNLQGLSWFLRILTVLAILGIMMIIIVFVTEVCRYYRKCWCALSLRFVNASLASLLIFGDAFRKRIPINTVLVFLVMQIIYLVILVYLDCHFEYEHNLEKWYKIQHS